MKRTEQEYETALYLLYLQCYGDPQLRSGSFFNDTTDVRVCALELESKVMGRLLLTDDPDVLDRPDIRGLNDEYVDDARRTCDMIRLLAALSDWQDLTIHQRIDWSERVMLRLVRELLPAVVEHNGNPASARLFSEMESLTDERLPTFLRVMGYSRQIASCKDALRVIDPDAARVRAHSEIWDRLCRFATQLAHDLWPTDHNVEDPTLPLQHNPKNFDVALGKVVNVMVEEANKNTSTPVAEGSER